MNNYVIVSLKDDLAKQMAKKVASILKLNYVDANSRFDDLLIASIDAPTILVDESLQEKETEIICELANLNDVVVGITNEMFLSNENYKNFANSKIVLITVENLKKINQNIQNFIKNLASLGVNEDVSEEQLAKMLKNL